MRSRQWRIDRAPLRVAAALAGGLLAAPALAQVAPIATISVTGEATVSVPPDLAQIDAGVSTEAKTAREASEANNAAMGKLLLALKGAGIEEKDFQTSRLSLQPQYASNRSGPNAVAGYRAANRVTIKLRDVTKVAGHDRPSGRGGRQRTRRRQFRGDGGLQTARRRARAGGRRCAPQGRDLRQGRRRHARLTRQHFGRGGARADAVPQDGRRRRGFGASGAGRRNAAGHGERILGDQAGSTVASSYAGLTRLSILFARSLSKMMDRRVKPGNDV
jgi:hypothetical protein